MKLTEILTRLSFLDTSRSFYARGSNKIHKFTTLYANNLRQLTSLQLDFQLYNWTLKPVKILPKTKIRPDKNDICSIAKQADYL